MAGSQRVIGVLALQGDVREHLHVLEKLGATTREVRSVGDLEAVDALVIPGGESSVIDKLSKIFGLRNAIRERLASGMPAFGTCAGLILLSDRVSDAISGQETFGGLDVTVRRNAFGSQTESFETALSAPAVAERPLAVAFIRAPVVEEMGPHVEVLASLDDGRIVGVRQGNIIGISAHPEITGETAFHEYFLDVVRAEGSTTPR